nr:transposase [Thiococcus pfennigii]
MSDARLVDFDGESVTLRYKDYRDGARGKVMRLSGEELLRRFLLHVLPKGFMRVRHYGFLANRCRARRLPEIRAAIAAAPPPTQATEPSEGTPFAALIIAWSKTQCERNDSCHLSWIISALRRDVFLRSARWTKR